MVGDIVIELEVELILDNVLFIFTSSPRITITSLVLRPFPYL